jgi:diguanylate cyclase (GGDEF)-like protein/PAS domain S-box-containing protein
MNWQIERGLSKLAAAVVYRYRCQPDWGTEFVGDGVIALTGYSAKDFLEGKLNSLLEIVHPDDIDYVQKAFFTPPVLVASHPETEEYRLSYRIVHKDGLIRKIYDRGRRIWQEGRWSWLSGVLFDSTPLDVASPPTNSSATTCETSSATSSATVSASATVATSLTPNPQDEPAIQGLLQQLQALQQQLQQSNDHLTIAHLALAAQQQRYQDLFNYAPDGYLVTGPTGIIYEANQAMAGLLGTDSLVLLGKSLSSWVEFSHAAQLCQVCQQLSASPATKSPQPLTQTLTVMVSPQQAAPFLAELTVRTVLNGQNEVVGLHWLVRDISHIKQLETGYLQDNAQLQKQVAEKSAALKQVSRSLKQLAYTDHLTQIANRRQFDERLNQEWRRLQCQSAPLTLILCDVDHFKHYNDSYGHLAGDDCLRRVAQVLRHSVGRPGDVVARYGGEEFALILPATQSEGAIHLIQKIQAQIADLQILNQSNMLTLSFGLATFFSAQENTPTQLITAADQALYRAKQNGRNCYMQAERE